MLPHTYITFIKSLLIFAFYFRVAILNAQPSNLAREIQSLDAIYNFNFKKADSILNVPEDNRSITMRLASVNLYWWLYISGDNSPTLFGDFEAEIQRILTSLPKKNNELSVTDIEAYIQAYALRFRMNVMHKNYFKCLSDLQNCISFLKQSFGKEEEHEVFYISSGLYNYLIAKSQKTNPWLIPYLLIYPKGGIELGLQQLIKAYGSKDKNLKTEAAYFLMKIYLEQENKPAQALIFSSYLTKNYPDNLVFRLHHLQVLAKEKPEIFLSEAAEIKKITIQNNRLEEKQKSHFVNLIEDETKKFNLSRSNLN